MKKAFLIDKAEHLDGEFFIYQEGEEPNKLSGPLLINPKDADHFPNAVIDENGEIKKSSSPYTTLSILENVCRQVAEEKIEDKIKNRFDALFVRGVWEGEDLGKSNERIGNVYSAGEFFGFRLENAAELPNSSAKNVGHLVYLQSNEKVYCDVGYKLKRISAEKFEKNFLLSTGETKIEVDISDSDIDNAILAIWQVSANSKDFLRLNCKITTPNEKKVVIEFEAGTEPGTYRLLGVE